MTIASNKNIYDYCAGVRAKGAWKLKATCVEEGIVGDKGLPKTLRYFVATKGCKFVKIKENPNPTGIGLPEVKIIKLEAENCLEQALNRINPGKPFSDYPIDVKFYIRKIRREINNIDPKHSQEAMDFYEIKN
jgi:hypothetical protein